MDSAAFVSTCCTFGLPSIGLGPLSFEVELIAMSSTWMPFNPPLPRELNSHSKSSQPVCLTKKPRWCFATSQTSCVWAATFFALMLPQHPDIWQYFGTVGCMRFTQLDWDGFGLSPQLRSWNANPKNNITGKYSWLLGCLWCPTCGRNKVV